MSPSSSLHLGTATVRLRKIMQLKRVCAQIYLRAENAGLPGRMRASVGKRPHAHLYFHARAHSYVSAYVYVHTYPPMPLYAANAYRQR